MNIWSIADLHLCLSCPEKTMEDFGPSWKNYIQRIQDYWSTSVQEGDIVLIPGDITWAHTLEQALIDLKWIDALPGKKVMIQGNHDYWWQSIGKVRAALPKSITALQHDALNLEDLSIGGSRLWDTTEYSSSEIIDFKVNPKANVKAPILTDEDNDRIYNRELHRLELSLKQMNPDASHKIVMTHYPPLSYDLQDSRVHQLLKKHQIQVCIFGHIHNLKPNLPPLFGEKEGIQYKLVAADYLQFQPLQILF